jgi:hypothetical protein
MHPACHTAMWKAVNVQCQQELVVLDSGWWLALMMMELVLMVLVVVEVVGLCHVWL